MPVISTFAALSARGFGYMSGKGTYTQVGRLNTGATSSLGGYDADYHVISSAIDLDGNRYYILVQSYPAGLIGYVNSRLIKIDKDGLYVWGNSNIVYRDPYGPYGLAAQSVYFNSVNVDTSQNVKVTTTDGNTFYFKNDGTVGNYTNFGTIVTQATHSRTKTDSSSNTYTLDYSYSGSDGIVLITKKNSSGTTIWTKAKTYVGAKPGNNPPTGHVPDGLQLGFMAIDDSNNIYFTYGTSNTEMYLASMTSNGDTRYINRISFSQPDTTNSNFLYIYPMIQSVVYYDKSIEMFGGSTIMRVPSSGLITGSGVYNVTTNVSTNITYVDARDSDFESVTGIIPLTPQTYYWNLGTNNMSSGQLVSTPGLSNPLSLAYA